MELTSISIGATKPERTQEPSWVRFGLVMIACAAGRLLLVGREQQMEAVLAPLSRWTAACTAWLLSHMGTDFLLETTTLTHPGGPGYTVTYLCTGLVIVAFFLAGLVALPAAARRRLRAAVPGSVLILALNQARLVTLFWLGGWNEQWFDFVHTVVWEAAMLLFVLGLWLAVVGRGPRMPAGAAATAA